MESREVQPPFPVYVRGDDSCTGWAVRKHRLSYSLCPGTNRTFLWDSPAEVNELTLTTSRWGHQVKVRDASVGFWNGRARRRKSLSSQTSSTSAAWRVPFRMHCQPHRRRLTRIRITFRENFFERGVMAIDVVVKMNESILSDDSGAIDD
jgi:hypothetical protein